MKISKKDYFVGIVGAVWGYLSWMWQNVWWTYTGYDSSDVLYPIKYYLTVIPSTIANMTIDSVLTAMVAGAVIGILAKNLIKKK